MNMQSTMNAAPQCREWLGEMPANKSHELRQAYWWVFTYPGSLCGAVVEIREAAVAGAVFKTRRYAVTERMADRFPARVFEFFKPYKDRKPDGSPDRYTVRFAANDAKLNRCGCRAFQTRGRCVHLESLLCLMGPKSGAKRVDAAAPKMKEKPAPKRKHDWERKLGSRSTFLCVNCSAKSFDPAVTDRHPEAGRCPGKSDKDGRATVAPVRSRPAAGPTPRGVGTGGKPTPAPVRTTGPSQPVRGRGKGKPHGGKKRPGKAR